MENDTQNKITQLERRVTELENWKSQRQGQQITLPLDPTSLEILRKYFLSIVGTFKTLGVSGREFTNFIINQDTLGFLGYGEYPLVTFTSATSDILTTGFDILTKKPFLFSNDDRVTVYDNGNGLPTGLLGGMTYYVVSVSANTFKLSDTLGGSPIDLTTTGSGFIQLF